MAIEIPGKKLTAAAGENLTQYTFVKATTGTGQITVVTATTAATTAVPNFLGVVQNEPTSGKAGELMLDGVSKVKALGAIKTGQYVKLGAGGGVEAIVVGTGEQAVGLAQSTTTATGQLVSVLILHGVNG
jgi:hypothetical protein